MQPLEVVGLEQWIVRLSAPLGEVPLQFGQCFGVLRLVRTLRRGRGRDPERDEQTGGGDEGAEEAEHTAGAAGGRELREHPLREAVGGGGPGDLADESDDGAEARRRLAAVLAGGEVRLDDGARLFPEGPVEVEVEEARAALSAGPLWIHMRPGNRITGYRQPLNRILWTETRI